MKAHAGGGWKSVFECFLTETEHGGRLADVRVFLELNEDRFPLLPLAGADDIQTLGIVVKSVGQEFY